MRKFFNKKVSTRILKILKFKWEDTFFNVLVLVAKKYEIALLSRGTSHRGAPPPWCTMGKCESTCTSDSSRRI
jgi:hypothetical protein